MNILTNVLLGKKSRVTNAIGYIDTGNTLRCALSGRYVVIATYEVASALVSQAFIPFIDNYMRNPDSVSAGLPEGFYLIPFNTICSNNQLMLAMDADYMFIDNTYVERRPLIGISAGSINVLHTQKCVLLNKYYMKRGKRNVKHNKGQRF